MSDDSSQTLTQQHVRPDRTEARRPHDDILNGDVWDRITDLAKHDRSLVTIVSRATSA